MHKIHTGNGDIWYSYFFFLKTANCCFVDIVILSNKLKQVRSPRNIESSLNQLDRY